MRKDWEYKKLGEVCETSSGGTPSKTYTEYYENGTIPWLRSGEVSQGYIYDAEIYISELGLNKSSAKIFPKGTVLIAMYGATVGEVGILCNPMCTNQAICGVLPNDLYNSEFLRYVLLSHKDKYLSLAIGGAQPNISQQIIKNTLIPLIDKSTQLSIVAELDKINELIQLKKQQLKDYDQLAQSIFYEMFGDPVENEKGWEVKRLGDISEFKNGLNFSKSDTGFSYKFLGVSDFQDKHIIHSSDLSNIHLSDKISEDYHLKKGDIVFVRSNGSKELVGRNVLLNISEPTTFSGFCIRCRLVDCRTNIVYLSYLLKSATIRPLITNNGRGCNISNVNQKILSMLSVPLPPLPLQQQFAARIEAIERQKQQVSETIKDLETLLASRMQYWFD